MTEPYEFRYPAGCPAKVCDVALGAFYQRKQLQKHKRKVFPYSANMRTMLITSVVLLIILAVAKEFIGDTSLLLIPIYLLIIVFGALAFLSLFSFMSARRQLRTYRDRNKSPGTIRFDETGIADENDDGTVTKMPWQDYETCIVTSEAITLIFKPQNIIFVEMNAEHLQHVETALRRFGKESTICYVMF